MYLWRPKISLWKYNSAFNLARITAHENVDVINIMTIWKQIALASYRKVLKKQNLRVKMYNWRFVDAFAIGFELILWMNILKTIYREVISLKFVFKN